VNHRKLALGTLVVVALGLLMASPAAWAALVKAADWRMNERSGRMIDSSRNHNHGSPKHVVRTGSTYVFNGSTSRVAVPDDKSLDPAARGITLRASVRVAGRGLDDDSYDVVRKGLSGTPGGHYKMEIIRTDPTVGNLYCLFKGTKGKVNRLAQPDIVDRKWHTLACTKTRNSVVARVDGRSYTRRGSAGSISNQKEVLIGAKTTNPLDDVFHGSMNRVSIDIAK
jgi:Concanavalin A-like lectin/glucanases superfamily